MNEFIFNNLTGAIIPHSGKLYGGPARDNIFKNLKGDKFKYIIYIAALHDNTNSNIDDSVYILKEDTEFNNYFINCQATYNKNLSNGAKKEHSFIWVESELKENFKKAKILVLCPTFSSDLIKLSNDIIKFIENNNKDNILLLATTDLIHYGERFNNLNYLSYPHQLNKWRKEELLINDLLKNEINNENINIMCGRNAIKTFIYISKYFNWNAKVIDYYDSYEMNNLINRYSITFDNNIEFVSYVSIIYGKFENNDSILLPIDIYLGIGLIKSIIYSNFTNIDHDLLKLPLWCNLNKLNNGIFVGTQQLNNDNNYETNGCVGSFQQDYKSISDNIISSSKNLFNDAKNRWKKEYTINNLYKHKFKIEILDDKNIWKLYKSATANENLILDGNYGVYLKIAENKVATFLPCVAEENKDKLSINEYMQYLSIKAGGEKDDWKNEDSLMYIYKCSSYIYEPETNSVKKLIK